MDVTKMNAKLLTKELSQRGLATHDLTPALTERLEQTINNQPESISNDEFHALNKNATSDDGKIAEKEQRIAELKAGNKAELKAEEAELAEAKHHRAVTQRKLKDLEPRLSVSPKLPTSVLLSILGQLGKKAGERAACVKREWRDVVGTAKALGMYRTKVFSVVALWDCSAAAAEARRAKPSMTAIQTSMDMRWILTCLRWVTVGKVRSWCQE